jgi:hypothetical protein
MTTRSRSIGHEIRRLVWDKVIQSPVHNFWALDPIVGQVKLAYPFLAYFLKANFDIIVSSSRRSHKWSLLLKCSENMVRVFLVSPC